MRPLFYAALLSGCATAPMTVPADKLVCFAIEEYRHCVAIVGEYRPEVKRELGGDYCKKIAIAEGVNVSKWQNYSNNWNLWGCEK